jgi:prepilin-type N-terminal cleavage/methylation domain-containing protein
MRSAPIRRPPGGFTLIELTIVLAIIAILATLAASAYGKFVNKARFTQAQTALKHLQKTQAIYFTENNVYADNVVWLDFEPVRYDYYRITVALDNSGHDFTGYANGEGVMAGDRWHINRDNDPIHDTPTF